MASLVIYRHHYLPYFVYGERLFINILGVLNILPQTDSIATNSPLKFKHSQLAFPFSWRDRLFRILDLLFD